MEMRYSAIPSLLLCAVLAACSSPAGPAAGTKPAGPASPAAQSAPADTAGGKATVTTGPDGIDIVGKGDGQVPAFAVNQPYYIATIDVGDMENAILTIPGHDLPALMTIGKTLRVLHVPEGAKQVSFTVEATGAYMVHLAAPPSTASAKTAPASFSGGKGVAMTDVVAQPKGVHLKLTDTSASGTSGMGATLVVYDAATGREVMAVSATAGNAEEQANENAKGPVFAIVTSAHDSWTLEFQS